MPSLVNPTLSPAADGKWGAILLLVIYQICSNLVRFNLPLPSSPQGILNAKDSLAYDPATRQAALDNPAGMLEKYMQVGSIVPLPSNAFKLLHKSIMYATVQRCQCCKWFYIPNSSHPHVVLNAKDSSAYDPADSQAKPSSIRQATLDNLAHALAKYMQICALVHLPAMHQICYATAS